MILYLCILDLRLFQLLSAIHHKKTFHLWHGGTGTLYFAPIFGWLFTFIQNKWYCYRPLCSAQLAVGCALGVALWSVDPASLGTRPSASCLTHLPHPTSVNTVGWDPQVIFICSSFSHASSILSESRYYRASIWLPVVPKIRHSTYGMSKIVKRLFSRKSVEGDTLFWLGAQPAIVF